MYPYAVNSCFKGYVPCIPVLSIPVLRDLCHVSLCCQFLYKMASCPRLWKSVRISKRLLVALGKLPVQISVSRVPESGLEDLSS
jgi:hypothetical protein